MANISDLITLQRYQEQMAQARSEKENRPYLQGIMAQGQPKGPGGIAVPQTQEEQLKDLLQFSSSAGLHPAVTEQYANLIKGTVPEAPSTVSQGGGGTTSDLQRVLDIYKSAKPDATPTDLYNAAIQWKTANMSPYLLGEGAYSKGEGKYLSEIGQGIDRGADTAYKMNATIDQIETLADPSNVGKFATESQWLQSVGDTLGLDVNVKELGSRQALKSISNAWALQVRSPDGPYGGLPGAISEGELKFMQDTVANMEQTPEGIRLISQFTKAINDKAIGLADEYAAFLDEHRANNTRPTANSWRKRKQEFNKQYNLRDRFQEILGPTTKPKTTKSQVEEQKPIEITVDW